MSLTRPSPPPRPRRCSAVSGQWSAVSSQHIPWLFLRLGAIRILVCVYLAAWTGIATVGGSEEVARYDVSGAAGEAGLLASPPLPLPPYTTPGSYDSHKAPSRPLTTAPVPRCAGVHHVRRVPAEGK